MILFILFRLLSVSRLHPETPFDKLRTRLRLGYDRAEAKRYRLLGRTGLVSSLDRQN